MVASIRANVIPSLLLVGLSATHAAARTDATTAAGRARAYPIRLVRIVEPFGAGGGPDLLARALAEQLAELWRQPVKVENIAGAGATAAPAQVVTSAADGHTLLVNTNAQAYSAALQGLPYDPLRDFIPVLPLTTQPYVLVAGKSAGFTTISELIAAAKAKPGELRLGSAGVGTGTHIGGEMFNQAAGIEALHVPAQPTDSNAQTIAHAIAGRFTYYLAPISLALTAIRGGGLVALGVSTARRSTLLPDVPTIAEAGVVGFDFPIWYGVWVRAGTPADVVETLADDIDRVLAGPEMRDWIAKHGGEPMRMTQPEFARFVLGESEVAMRMFNPTGREHR